MAENKFLDKTGLTRVFENTNARFSKIGHKHTKADITDFAHTHDDRYYTETEMDSKLSGKANSSHTHTKSQITDFPSSMKNPNSLTISLNGTSQGAYDGSAAKSINVTPSSIGAATSGHTHNYAGSSSAGGAANSATKLATSRKLKVNLAGADAQSFDGSADAQSIGVSGKLAIVNGGTGADSINEIRTNIGVNAVTTAGTGAAYTASVGGLTLVAGASFVMVPHVVSTTATPTLNVNGLGAKNIRMRISSSTVATTALPSVSFLAANKPVRMMYDGAQWVIDDMVRPDANNLYGTIISRGTAAPTSSTEGYIYIQTT